MCNVPVPAVSVIPQIIQVYSLVLVFIETLAKKPMLRLKYHLKISKKKPISKE
jgi:hypothetical protein